MRAIDADGYVQEPTEEIARTLESVVALCGEDVVVFATVYPHPDALAGDVVVRITSRTASARARR